LNRRAEGGIVGRMSATHMPRLVERESGGWLAVTEPDDDLHIGVTAETEAEARERFGHALDAWLRLLDAARGVDRSEN
jgi:hypothetical protein